MAEKYSRLVCFVVNICAELLRDFLTKLARNDAGTSFTTIDAYLTHRKSDIDKLKNMRKIRHDQYLLLYPGHGTADEDQWDVTLLVTLITELFSGSLQPLDIFFLKNEIREIRNELQHLPNTNISDVDFDNYWGRLETAVMTIAKQTYVGAGVSSLQKKVEDAKLNNLPTLEKSLHMWYGEKFKEMDDKLCEMDNKLSEMQPNTRETASIMRKVTVQKPGPSGGDKNKRIKIADNILANLQVEFERTMMELQEDFCSPEEVATIRTSLRDDHYVVVTGSYNSRYTEAALAAIKGMDYNYKRCVKMSKSSDWRHIDPEDVDLVLCRNPFGNDQYDENKAKSMADIFNSMMLTAKGDGGKEIDIVIVTDLAVFTECHQYHDHDILGNVVKVYDDTTEECPADLTFGCGNTRALKTVLPIASTLKVFTSTFLQQNNVASGQVDEKDFKKASDILKSKKVVVITGANKPGRTSLAVALASKYTPSQCILLSTANDVDKIDFQHTCLVIIDEFAGKYRYEENDTYKWYSMFDHLYNAVVAGLINVVVTCEKSKLDRCCKEIAQHPLLEHRVELQERNEIVKQEQVHTTTENLSDQLASRTTRILTEVSNPHQWSDPHIWSVEDKLSFNIRVQSDRTESDISGCCLLSSGEILLADTFNKRLKKLDSQYKVINVLDLPNEPTDVCYIVNNKAVAACGYKLQYIDIRDEMSLTTSVNTDYLCGKLTCHGDKLYVRHGRSVNLYSTYGTKQRVLYPHHSYMHSYMHFYIHNIAINAAGDKIYLACGYQGLRIIDHFGNLLHTFTDSELRVNSVCVDDEDNVFVYDGHSRKILQISSDGKQKLGILETWSCSKENRYKMLFDKDNKALVLAGFSDSIDVLKLV